MSKKDTNTTNVEPGAALEALGSPEAQETTGTPKAPKDGKLRTKAGRLIRGRLVPLKVALTVYADSRIDGFCHSTGWSKAEWFRRACDFMIDEIDKGKDGCVPPSFFR